MTEARTLTLTDFLLARIAEDEDEAVADAQAKRRIIKEHQRFGSYDERLHDDLVLCLLALPYADHPDYREAWRP